MKTVGRRQEQPILFHATGEQLAEGARFSEVINALARMPFIPKGVRRFKTHEAANLHWNTCLAQGMAKLAAARIR
jgi:hypothetical protein